MQADVIAHRARPERASRIDSGIVEAHLRRGGQTVDCVDLGMIAWETTVQFGTQRRGEAVRCLPSGSRRSRAHRTSRSVVEEVDGVNRWTRNRLMSVQYKADCSEATRRPLRRYRRSEPHIELHSPFGPIAKFRLVQNTSEEDDVQRRKQTHHDCSKEPGPFEPRKI